MQFKIEQVAIAPAAPITAMQFLRDLGLTEWSIDTVKAEGHVFGFKGENTANLAFNYEATAKDGKPLELEVLDYTDGPNWIDRAYASGGFDGGRNVVSHFGMHVTEEELAEFDVIFKRHRIEIAQEVNTQSHTNPHIKDSRRYHYRIYNTRVILGVDLKFIVRKSI
jgi:hypothetical protein